ncbi:MAG: hypothetical protein J0H42_14325 [Rhizobiales bacterium]|nr:hypothetical protein [Hyphomicrobiales bacterium]
MIVLGELDFSESTDRSPKDVVGDFERGLITETLRRHHGDVLAVSESLGISKKTPYDKMWRYALSGEGFRSSPGGIGEPLTRYLVRPKKSKKFVKTGCRF